MATKTPKISVRVYPWHDLAWDLALAEGMNPAEIERRLDQNSKNDRPRQPIPAGLSFAEVVKQTSVQLVLEAECDKEAASIKDEINTYISTQLWRDILEGNLAVRKANGNPMNGDPKLFKMLGPEAPHLRLGEGNDWLTKNRYLQEWVPGDLKNPKGTNSNCAGRPNSAAPVTNWRHLVQAEAYKHWLRLRASGANPSVNSICPDMAKWCAKQGIKGDKNQDPKAGTIRNTVLGAGHWKPPPHSVEQAKDHVAQTAQMKVAQEQK